MNRLRWSLPLPFFQGAFVWGGDHMTHVIRVLKESVRGFQKHNAPRLGAALAFYTLLSLSPMMLMVLAMVGAIFGDQAAHGAVAAQTKDLVGAEGARAIEDLVASADKPGGGILATVFGVIVLVFAATGVFVELKGALDAIWETKSESKGLGLRALALDRLLAFSVICGMAFLLLVSLLFSAVLSALGNKLGSFTFSQKALANALNVLLSFTITTAMFAMIFKLLPSSRPRWSQVWIGAQVTTALFMVGKALIGLYLGRAAVGSAYGAAGSLVVLLIWVYYSTQILLFGAEITRTADTLPEQPAPT